MSDDDDTGGKHHNKLIAAVQGAATKTVALPVWSLLAAFVMGVVAGKLF